MKNQFQAKAVGGGFLVNNPYFRTEEARAPFRAQMVALGGLYNGTYNGWNIPAEAYEQARALVESLPEQDEISRYQSPLGYVPGVEPRSAK